MRVRAARAAVAAAVFVALVTATSGAEEQALERDIWGYFLPTARPPAAFANITELHLAGRGEYGWRASPPYYGMIKTSGRGSAPFVLKQPVIDGLNIRFTTDEVRGVSYEFAGLLARADFSRGGIPLDQVMLHGTMHKLRNGKRIAVSKLSFTFQEGG